MASNINTALWDAPGSVLKSDVKAQLAIPAKSEIESLQRGESVNPSQLTAITIADNDLVMIYDVSGAIMGVATVSGLLAGRGINLSGATVTGEKSGWSTELVATAAQNASGLITLDYQLGPNFIVDMVANMAAGGIVWTNWPTAGRAQSSVTYRQLSTGGAAFSLAGGHSTSAYEFSGGSEPVMPSGAGKWVELVYDQNLDRGDAKKYVYEERRSS